MKRYALSVTTVAVAAALLMGAEREGRGGGHGVIQGGGGARGGGGRAPSAAAPASRAPAPSTVIRQQRVVVPKAPMPAPEHVVREQRRFVAPRRNESGARITQPRASVPPSHHAAVVQNRVLINNIQRMQRVEVVPNRFFWHNVDGTRFCHFFDGRVHWWGFYQGPTFYWCQFFDDRWWWFDPRFARWVFWWNGFWWWPGPGGAAYVYIDNDYYPYQDSGITIAYEEQQTAPSAIPAPSAGSTTNSPDGRRMVQVFGDDGQAFLYDKTTSPPTFMKYLGQGVSRVRFSGGAGGTPTQILVEYKDDTFSLFDADGNSQSSAVKTEESTTPAPPESPESIPPPPTSAPGR